MFTGLLQPTHLLILLAVVLILLGPKRLPEAGRSLGQGLRQFRDSIGHDDPKPSLGEPEAPASEEATRDGHTERQPVA
jgi:sec-independent protein translocase protein TatA